MLIKCPECGKQVSDRAANCPECGCPINTPSVQPKPTQYETTKTQDSGCFMTTMNFGCATVGLIVLLFIIYAIVREGNDTETSMGIAALFLAIGLGVYWAIKGYNRR